MSQNKEPNNDKNNELMNKLNGIFGDGMANKENGDKKNELKNYIDGDEGEEIIPANRRHNDNEKELKGNNGENTSNKTTICRVLGWLSMAVGIAATVLGFVISPYFFIVCAVSAISLCINIGIVNSENKKQYLPKYAGQNPPNEYKEKEYGVQQYRNNEKQQDNVKNEQTKIENSKHVKEDAAKLDGVENFLNKKHKEIDGDEPSYTKQDENQAKQKENSI